MNLGIRDHAPEKPALNFLPGTQDRQIYESLIASPVGNQELFLPIIQQRS